MERFKERKSIAGTLQPGDGTRYEMVAVEMWDTVEVVVLNDGFFDRIVFLKRSLVDPENPFPLYYTHRCERTNPWTVKAAEEMVARLMAKAADE